MGWYAPDFGIALHPSECWPPTADIGVDRQVAPVRRSLKSAFSTATVRTRHPPRIYASIGPPADVGGLAQIGAGLAQDRRQLVDTG
jgi:hypothetical protein